MTLAAGETLRHYKIVSLLGTGGMGEVYLAEDTQLQRKVAIKLLPRAFAADAERMGRFVREARLVSALNHPNILTIHEVGEAAGQHYLTTEYIAGQTLRALIDRGPLPTGQCVDIALQIATALSAAHDAGIVHRDIKPENVIVRADGLVKVLDFGLAKAGGTDAVDPDSATRAHTQTQPGSIMGTVAYMSPEQSRGKAVDGRADIWSLGVVLYEMLSGRRPFQGETSTDIVADILRREPDFSAIRRPEVPADVDQFVTQSLAKDVNRRQGTSAEIVRQLKALKARLEYEGGSGQRSSPGGSHASSPTAADSGTSSTPSALGARSIAVMPFTNMSADPENDYFCDGLAEELLNALAKIEGLRVAARTSAFAFRGKPTTSSEIGRTLSVATILEGSVRRSGNRVRISVQLVDAAAGYQIWSERYDREMEDVFQVQDDITLAVVEALKVKLLGEDRAAALKRSTRNPEAYQLYLKGRFCWNKRTAESLQQAVAFYAQAVALDPGYALAHAGLAECYVLYAWLSVASPRESMPKARVAALRALELDEELAEPHAALGVYLSLYAWDQAASERELRRALEINPNHATATHWLGNIALLAMGRFDESIAALRRAEALDPLSTIIRSDTGVTLFYARRFAEAIEQFQQTLKLDPDTYVARYHMGLAYHATGQVETAIAEYRRCLATDDDPWVRALLARSLAKSGQTAEAREELELLGSEATRRYVPYVGFAIAHAGLGERDEAFAWLEKDMVDRSLYPPFYALDPVFDELRDDARFEKLVQRVAAATLREDQSP